MSRMRARRAMPSTPEARIAAFVTSVLLLSWLRLIPPLLKEYAGIESPTWLTGGVLPLLGSFGPVLVAVALTMSASGSAGAATLFRHGMRWRVPRNWYPTAVLGPALLYSTALAGLVLWGGQSPSFGPQDWVNVLAVFVGAFVFALGEEFGWRGYLQRGVQARASALTAGLLVGLVWALWHMPLFVAPDAVQSEIPFVPYLSLLVGLSVVFGWVYNGTGGSVLLVALMHAGFNASVGSVTLGLGSTDIGRFVVLCAVVTWLAVGVIVQTRGRQTLTGRP